MQSDPRVFYALSAVAAVVAAVVGFVFEPSFLSGLGVGISASFALVFLVVGVLTAQLRQQAEDLTNQMNAVLGSGDLDLGALMSGFGLGGLAGISGTPGGEVAADERAEPPSEPGPDTPRSP